jgi:hypothetical protein
MESLFSYMTFSAGYKMTNINNIYNFIYDMIMIENDDRYKHRVITMIKKNIGMTFYNNFMAYCIKKNLDIEFRQE